MTKETKETEKKEIDSDTIDRGGFFAKLKEEEELEASVRDTYFARAKAQIFAELGVHLTRMQIVNYCINYTLNEKTRQEKN
tara:strand:- start:138 stop:380 length:243 start_codon:yes stop_codon:yes gene_type:complete